MTTTQSSVEALYKPRKGVVAFVDVPELLCVRIDGAGDPDGPEFAAAVRALYTVSYGARFLLKKQGYEVHRVMPLEAQWWADDAQQRRIVAAVTAGMWDAANVDRSTWQWRAMIVQPDPIDEAAIAAATAQAERKQLPALPRLVAERWHEGRVAQLLHVGPYAEEGPSILKLHRAITDAGLRPRGRHHEIYMGDPRRSAPERLRTILRQPVEAVSD